MYYALRDETENVVVESKRTCFLFLLCRLSKHQKAQQECKLSFNTRSRVTIPFLLSSVLVVSGPSHPYPQSRATKITISPDQTHPFNVDVQPSLATPVLRQININQNVVSTAPSLEVLKPFSPLSMDVELKRENAYGLAPMARPRVTSVARRTALGWSKRSTGKSSTDQKENVGQGAVMTTGDTLRLDLVDVLLLLYKIVHRVPSGFNSWFHLGHIY